MTSWLYTWRLHRSPQQTVIEATDYCCFRSDPSGCIRRPHKYREISTTPLPRDMYAAHSTSRERRFQSVREVRRRDETRQGQHKPGRFGHKVCEYSTKMRTFTGPEFSASQQLLRSTLLHGVRGGFGQYAPVVVAWGVQYDVYSMYTDAMNWVDVPSHPSHPDTRRTAVCSGPFAINTPWKVR